MLALQVPRSLDLTSIGIERRFIPYILSVESGAEHPVFPPTQVDIQTIAEKLDEALSSPTVNQELKERCIAILRRLSRSHDVRPKSCSPSGVTLSGREPHMTAGSSEVWKGRLGGNQVCVKTFRVWASEMNEIKEGFYREIAQWKYISHPNVLPFLGVLEGLPGLHGFCIINPWLENGNVLEYINKTPDANRFQLLAQATLGLIRLHSLDIVHGSIHPGNILITKEGDARIADFGIAAILAGSAAMRSGSMATTKHGVVRYKAPELLGDNPTPSKESDIYSLAMVTFELLSGVPPYDKMSAPRMAYSIIKQERPARPDNETAGRWLSDPIWAAIQRRWGEDPQSRWPLSGLHHAFLKLGEREGTGSSTDAPGRVVQQSSIEIDPPSGDPRLSRGIHDILGDPATSSNQPVQSSGRNDHTPFDWRTSSNQLAQSPDRVSATSRKSGSLKRVKHIWYYYTCRCCSE